MEPNPTTDIAEMRAAFRSHGAPRVLWRHLDPAELGRGLGLFVEDFNSVEVFARYVTALWRWTTEALAVPVFRMLGLHFVRLPWPHALHEADNATTTRPPEPFTVSLSGRPCTPGALFPCTPMGG